MEHLKRVLTTVLILVFVVPYLAVYLNSKDTLDYYIKLVDDYVTGSYQDPFVKYVNEQLPNLSLYRFYKIKMVGSVDKRESALDIPFFLMVLLREQKIELPGEQTFRLGDVCKKEEGGLLDLTLLFNVEEEKKKAIEDEQKCIQEVLSKFRKTSYDAGIFSVNFNEIFGRALFLSYVESHLKGTNVSKSLVKNSSALTYAFNLYNRYIRSDIEKAFVHLLIYYLGLTHEKPPFEVKGIDVEGVEGVKYVKVYPGEKYLISFEKIFDRSDVLGFKNRLIIALDELKKVEYESSRDFEWTLKIVSEYIFEKFVEPNIRRIEWSALKNNAQKMIEHTFAYYLGATDIEPPIKLEYDVTNLKCGESVCTYRFYRYRAPEEIQGIVNIPDVKKSIEKALNQLRNFSGDSLSFSKEIESVAGELEAKAKSDIENLKEVFAEKVVKISPKKLKYSWLRFLVYVILLIVAMWKFKGRLKDVLLLIIIAEIFYITFAFNPDDRAEGMFYSLAVFFSFAFVILLSLQRLKKKWIYVAFGGLLLVFLFLPTYSSVKYFIMDNHEEFYKSPYYDLLRDDLYDGAKFELKKKLSDEEIVSRFSRALNKAISSGGVNSGSFREAMKLADKIVKYGGERIRKDFYGYLNYRLAKKPEMLKEFEKIFEKYSGKEFSPNVLSLQSLNAIKASLVFMLIFTLSYFGIRRKILGIIGLISSALLIIPSLKVFVEFAVPYITIIGKYFYMPWIQILLIVFSIFIIFSKNLEREG